MNLPAHSSTATCAAPAALQEAIHASVESAQVETAMRASQQAQQGAAPAAEGGQPDQGPVLSDADFPSVSAAGGGGAAAGTGARWAGAATGGTGGAGGLRAEDFPALPGGKQMGGFRRRAVRWSRFGGLGAPAPACNCRCCHACHTHTPAPQFLASLLPSPPMGLPQAPASQPSGGQPKRRAWPPCWAAAARSGC